tara:strand:+ start:30 stop:836 length:807 start_codon:yes stop_codon:yes gene_type:complete
MAILEKPRYKLIDTDEACNIGDVVNNIHSVTPIKYIYISIGSKQNKTGFMGYKNNGKYQMCPDYLNNTAVHNLVIVFDLFNSHELAEQQIIHDEIPNTTIIICNWYCERLFLKNFIPYIIKFSRDNRILPPNLVICNYVKFANVPNSIERMHLDNIPKCIHSILSSNANKDYVECFYEWFGYNHYLYNYIYNYKYHSIYRGAYSSLSLLFDTIQTTEVDPSYVLELKNPNIVNFWKYIYNISDSSNNPHLVSMCDEFIENDTIRIEPI